MKMEKIYTCIYERFSLLKRESFPTLSKFLWVVSFISHGHSSFLKAFFEIELGPLDFNMVSKPSLRCWAYFPLLLSMCLVIVSHMMGHIKKREFCPTLSKFLQVFWKNREWNLPLSLIGSKDLEREEKIFLLLTRF